jgi:hypothetical protein
MSLKHQDGAIEDFVCYATENTEELGDTYCFEFIDESTLQSG